jgi:phage-related protein
MPHTRAMGEGLHELRLKGPDGLVRVFYCVVGNRRIVMLHSFVKKSAKTPPKELAKARERLRKIRQ